jgi:formamidopyrimidine-DNA glycosylase
MPEGHLVHHYARRQTRDLAGRPVRARSPQGRFADGAATSAAKGRIVFAPARERRVYRRDACGRCGDTIARSVIGGRTAYVCPRCQA